MKAKHIHGRKLGIPNFICTSMPGYTYSLKSKNDRSLCKLSFCNHLNLPYHEICPVLLYLMNIYGRCIPNSHFNINSPLIFR